MKGQVKNPADESSVGAWIDLCSMANRVTQRIGQGGDKFQHCQASWNMAENYPFQ
jgi:hypothetical protein